jgi:uncharacterized protein
MITDHAVYVGEVWHRREKPIVHAFRYPFWWLWLNLDDVDGLLGRSRWWGRRWRPGVIRETDYLDGDDGSLSRRCRRKAAELGLNWQDGAVCMLTQPRLFGWLFNPLTLYWHFPAGESRADSVMAEVHNTPWHERHWYPLPLSGDGDDRIFEHDKAFHVSPFMALDMRYRWSLSQNHRDLSVTISNIDADGRLFAAGVRMQRRDADAVQLVSVLRNYPAQSLKASMAIYAHAWRLWRKGVAFHRHPGKPGKTTE